MTEAQVHSCVSFLGTLCIFSSLQKFPKSCFFALSDADPGNIDAFHSCQKLYTCLVTVSSKGYVPPTAVAALHQGVPGQMTWLEDPPPWLKPWLRPA